MPSSSIADHYTVVAGLASAVARHAQSYGIDINPICQALDLDPELFQSLTGRVSLDRLCRLLEACAVLSNDEAFGLKCTARFVAGASGPFGYGLICAPDVSEFLRFLEAHSQYATHTSYVKSYPDSKGVRIEWAFAPAIVKRDQYIDMSMGLLIQRLRDIIGDKIDMISIDLERPKPRNIAVFRDHLNRQVNFGCKINAIHVPRSLLDVPNPKGDHRLFTLMDLQCQAMRPENDPTEHDFVDQVRHYLGLRISEQDLSLTDVASYFGISERTFQRRLADRNTSLAGLRDEVRRDISHDLLTNSDLSISEICFRLGYSAPSAFTRSVSRWFGQTPKSMRGAKAG